MAQVRNTLIVTVTATLTLDEAEIRAFDALVGYGDDAFLKAFEEKLGKAYIENHRDGLRSAFSAIRTQILPALSKVDRARRDLAGAEEARRKAEQPL